MSEESRCGFVAIIGRPNVGKSTLLNHILGQKISITSRKPQTTRHRILGIKTINNEQIIYVDTPGLHIEAKRALNRYMNRTALNALHDVDVVLFMVDSLKWQDDDDWVLKKLSTLLCPIILVINKVDQITDKEQLLPHITELMSKGNFVDVMPISAIKGINLEKLESTIGSLLPENPHFFPDDQITDASQRFMAAEIIREKLLRSLGQEVPYALTVEIEKYQETEKLVHIAAVIWVEKMSQKAIVIGKEGGVLKKVGTRARKELEFLLEQKVFLQLWVKVKESWSDNERALRSLGYHDQD